MTNESDDDVKILAVPIDKLCQSYRKVTVIDDMPPMLLDQIAHFFEHYKDLDESMRVRVEGRVESRMPKKKSCPASPCTRMHLLNKTSKILLFF